MKKKKRIKILEQQVINLQQDNNKLRYDLDKYINGTDFDKLRIALEKKMKDDFNKAFDYGFTNPDNLQRALLVEVPNTLEIIDVYTSKEFQEKINKIMNDD